MTKTLMELRAEAEASAAGLNKAVLSDSHKAIGVASEALKKAIAAYNEAAQAEEFGVLFGFDDPLLEALKRLTIPCIKADTKSDKDTGISHTEIKDDRVVIDLLAFEKASERPLFHNGQFKYWLEAFCYRLAARANGDIGGDARKFSSTYKMGATAKEIELGAVPTSNAQMVKQLQAIVDGLYFIDNGDGLNQYKVITKDIKYILYLMCGRGRKVLSVAMPKPATMLRLVTEVMHRLVVDGEYTAEYEMVDTKANGPVVVTQPAKAPDAPAPADEVGVEA